MGPPPNGKFDINVLSLQNCSTIVATLPDQGEKLRATNNLIESILAKISPDGSYRSSPSNSGQESAIEEKTEENPLMNAMSKLSIKSKENGREHSVALANAEASNNQFISSGIMRTRKPSIAEGVKADSTSPDASVVCTNFCTKLLQTTESHYLPRPECSCSDDHTQRISPVTGNASTNI
jgi:hypothetical protein